MAWRQHRGSTEGNCISYRQIMAVSEQGTSGRQALGALGATKRPGFAAGRQLVRQRRPLVRPPSVGKRGGFPAPSAAITCRPSRRRQNCGTLSTTLYI